jgi:hypothetical protein
MFNFNETYRQNGLERDLMFIRICNTDPKACQKMLDAEVRLAGYSIVLALSLFFLLAFVYTSAKVGKWVKRLFYS